jgi:hypothetical protein
VRGAASAVEAFLMKVGRVRMVRPLYAAMMKSGDFWRDLATSTFARAKPKYHPVTRAALSDIIK